MSNFLRCKVIDEEVFAHFSSEPTEEDVHEAVMSCCDMLKHIPSKIEKTNEKYVYKVGDTKNKTTFNSVSNMRYDNYGFAVANFGDKYFRDYIDFDGNGHDGEYEGESEEDFDEETEDEDFDEYDFLYAMRYKQKGLVGHDSGKYFYWSLDDNVMMKGVSFFCFD